MCSLTIKKSDYCFSVDISYYVHVLCCFVSKPITVSRTVCAYVHTLSVMILLIKIRITKFVVFAQYTGTVHGAAVHSGRSCCFFCRYSVLASVHISTVGMRF